MNHDRAFVSNGRTEASPNSPQKFFVKLRRGTAYSYITDDGESESMDDAKDFASHGEAHVVSQIRLRESDVDGTEVEMVGK